MLSTPLLTCLRKTSFLFFFLLSFSSLSDMYLTDSLSSRTLPSPIVLNIKLANPNKGAQYTPGHQSQVAVGDISLQTCSPLLPIIIRVLHLIIFFCQGWQLAVIFIEVVSRINSRYSKSFNIGINWKLEIGNMPPHII